MPPDPPLLLYPRTLPCATERFCTLRLVEPVGFAWFACVDLRVVMVDIVSFPAQVLMAVRVIATINANTT